MADRILCFSGILRERMLLYYVFTIFLVCFYKRAIIFNEELRYRAYTVDK